jgi:hypothetical protein
VRSLRICLKCKVQSRKVLAQPGLALEQPGVALEQSGLALEQPGLAQAQDTKVPALKKLKVI